MTSASQTELPVATDELKPCPYDPTTQPFDEPFRHVEPLMVVECRQCGGEGSRIRSITVYERGCGYGHADEFAVRCDHCGGTGLGGVTVAETLEMHERDDD